VLHGKQHFNLPEPAFKVTQTKKTDADYDVEYGLGCEDDVWGRARRIVTERQGGALLENARAYRDYQTKNFAAAAAGFASALTLDSELTVARTQDSNETLTEDFGLEPVTVSLDNTLMGGIGRGTVRFEYRLGSSGLLRVYLDAGFQAKFTIVDYPDGGGSENELLWGPYAKLGVRYSF
jgi:hypothetical protein